MEVSKTHSSPKSLAERLGPLASTASKGLQDRIEPVVFRSRTPPPRSPVRQSAPSTLQRSRSPIPTEAAVAPPVARSFTPPLPSPAHRTAHRSKEVAVASTKDASPSPKLASSPSEAAQSSPRPSTTDLEQATSEVTQARTSPDISKEDENMLEDGTAEGREAEPAIGPGDAAIAQASQPSPNDGTIAQKTVYSALDSTSAKSVSLPSMVEALPAAIIQVAPDCAEAGHSPMLEKEAQFNEQHIRVEVEATLTKAETEDVDMEANVSSSESQTIVPAAQDVSNTSIVVKEVQMEVDEEQQRLESVTDEPSFTQDAQTDREATEEDPVATEFEKSLISFIETTEPDEDDNSVDLSNILEDNKLKAPISLPLAVSMPDAGQDVFEIQPLLLENHNLLDGWLRETMASRDKRRGEKIFRLRQQYKELDNEWQVHCNKLEKIRERQKRRQNMPIIPPTPSVDSAGISFMPTTPNLLAPSGRSNRRSAASSIGYGDAVRSEAEFLEILASLEDADMRDPNLRAMRTTAAVPDQIIDESEYTLQQYDDNNGLVTDPFEHYGINKTPDSWTEEEIAIFCRRYALYPKQFGKIAAALPDKSTNQCVLFYYRSKKKIDFRALVDRRNRDGRRKRSKGDKSDAKKGPSLLNNIERARGGEAEEDEDEEPQTPGSAMAQESTVISTAKALTQQINGFANGSARTEPVKRPLAGRSVSGKKATRFLSPSEDRSGNGTDDGVPPPSDGALAAAEALGFLSAIPSEDPNDPTAQPSNAKQKKRKPSMSESTLNTSFGEDGTPRPVNVAKRSRPHSSSYWSVADKNEFIRLLSVHGKNYVAIAEGIQSKTAVQCKNVGASLFFGCACILNL